MGSYHFLIGLVGCLVSYFVFCVCLFLFHESVVCFCLFAHISTPSFHLYFDGRGYLGTKRIYGQSGVLVFLLFSRFASVFFRCRSSNGSFMLFFIRLLFVVGCTWGMPLVNLYILLS